ncbi:MAG: putative sugar nucleotidyl transferase [Salibacteraceae bacterium]
MIQNIVLVDHTERDHLLPLTFTRPVAAMRIGIFTLAEKWQHLTGKAVSFKTQDYLSKLFPVSISDQNMFINGAVHPTKELILAIESLEEGQSLFKDDVWIATIATSEGEIASTDEVIDFEGTLVHIDRSWKIFQNNGWAIDQDLSWIRSQRKSEPIPAGVIAIGEHIFVEKGAQIQPSVVLNSEEGPIYIGANAIVMEGSMVRGALALSDHSQLKMGAKIYGPTTVGPHSKVGGEVNNSVIFGYTNKAHDGFLGNSVIGEWCNLGADTNTSNLKNTYADVKVFNYALGRSESTGSQFCGLIMGDHAKAGINTMFNTGTVCGVFANVFGGDFPHRNIPDFGWGGASGFKNYRLADALQVAEIVMARRGIELTKERAEAFTYLHESFRAEK